VSTMQIMNNNIEKKGVVICDEIFFVAASADGGPTKIEKDSSQNRMNRIVRLWDLFRLKPSIQLEHVTYITTSAMQDDIMYTH
jgi:ATP-dependent protease HslVU (ClpYQ) ATPase subunit